MSTYIERWMTPWPEEAILSAEKALNDEPACVKPEDVVVNAKNKDIGVVKWIRNDFITVFVKMYVHGKCIWAEKIWHVGCVRKMDWVWPWEPIKL